MTFINFGFLSANMTDTELGTISLEMFLMPMISNLCLLETEVAFPLQFTQMNIWNIVLLVTPMGA